VAYLTDDLVSAVRRRAQLPDADGKLDDAGILDIANEELQTFILPWLVEARETYYVKDSFILIEQGVDTYPLPTMLLAGTLFDVSVYNAQFESMGSLPMLPLEDSTSYGASGTWGYPASLCFTIQGNNLVLLPKPTGGDTLYLRLRYVRRPNRLVPVSECALVESWLSDTPTPGRTQFTVDAVPAGFTGSKIDLVQAIPSFEVWSEFLAHANATGTTFDVLTTSVNPNFFTAAQAGFLDGAPNQPAYWCVQQTTCIVPVPDFMQPVLVSITASQCLRSIGDFEGAEMEMQQLGRKMGQLKTVVEPRVEGARPRIVSFSHPMRASWNRGWWWF